MQRQLGLPVASTAPLARITDRFTAGVHRFAGDHYGRSYPWIVKTTGMVNHFYFYCVDRDFGPFFVKFCSYFPYNAKLWFKGNHWAAPGSEPRHMVLHITSEDARCALLTDLPRRRGQQADTRA